MLDIRAHPDILVRFTQARVDRGWTSAGESPDGHQHRWVKEMDAQSAQIDVLIPTNVGPRAAGRRGTTAGTTVQAPGGQQALDRAELITVDVAGTVVKSRGLTWPERSSSKRLRTGIATTATAIVI